MSRTMVKLLQVDGFFPPGDAQKYCNVVSSLQFQQTDYGLEVPNFNMIYPGMEPVFSKVLGEEVSIDEKRSGIFRRPMLNIHFEDFSSLNEWCFVVALERTIFNTYYHLGGAQTALDGYQFNYRNLFEWEYTTHVQLEANQGIFFRPWVFHSLQDGVVQYYRLKSDKEAEIDKKVILVMGLPGAGKTTFAKALSEKLNATHINADAVRTQYNDWDFSLEGRHRQAHRMRKLSVISNTKYTVVDFVCPTERTRDFFNADYIIWMNTIEKGRFEDTNSMFEVPSKAKLIIKDFNYDVTDVAASIVKEFTPK